MNRPVEVFEMKRNREVSGIHYDRVFIGNAIFHQFGCDYEEFEEGAGNFSTAIVEFKDGRVMNVPVRLITFLDRDKI